MFDKQSFSIGSHALKSDGDLFIVAEIGLAHEGSLGVARAMVDAAADCGVDAVKFQTHLADEESTRREKFRVKVFPQDDTRQDYWRRTAFELPQWIELADYTRSKELHFLSSPFSELAVDWLERCKVPAWKVASGELSNYPMLRRMCETQKPILLSSGMSDWNELDKAIGWIESNGGQYGVFQCTTSYPCPPEKWGINVIDQMLHRYNCPIGLSDHSGTPTPSIAAVARGATMLEVHLTFSKKQFGPDVKASLTVEDLASMVRSARDLRTAQQHPVDKDDQARELNELHSLFTKSIVAKRDLPAGHVLALSDLAFKKPGDGISACEFESVIGMTLRNDVVTDHFFTRDDLVN